MSALPFELNAKIKYGFQVSESYRAVVLSDECDYMDKVDCSEVKDVGMCITCILSLTPGSEGKVTVSLKSDEGSDTIHLDQGDIFVMKSRHINSYSVSKPGKKTVALLYWVSGPKDIKNRLF